MKGKKPNWVSDPQAPKAMPTGYLVNVIKYIARTKFRLSKYKDQLARLIEEAERRKLRGFWYKKEVFEDFGKDGYAYFMEEGPDRQSEVLMLLNECQSEY